MPVHLAAYGTLMTGEVNALSPRTRARLDSVGRCRIPGAMVRVWNGEGAVRIDYPGLVAREGSFVSGELFLIGDNDAEAADVLAGLDVYEDCRPDDPAGSYYARRLTEVVTADGDAPVVAWVYYFNRPVEGLEPIADGRWRAVAPRPAVAVADDTKPYHTRG